MRVSLLYTRGMENYRLSCLNLQDNDSSFPKWLYQSVLPLAVYVRALPDPYILLGLFSHLRFLLFDIKWSVTLICHFHILKRLLALCVYIAHICSLFCEMPFVSYPCLFYWLSRFNWFVWVCSCIFVARVTSDVLLNLLPTCSLCFYFFKAILMYREVFTFPFGASNVCGFLKKLLLFPRSENHSPRFSLKSYSFAFDIEIPLSVGIHIDVWYEVRILFFSICIASFCSSTLFSHLVCHATSSMYQHFMYVCSCSLTLNFILLVTLSNPALILFKLLWLPCRARILTFIQLLLKCLDTYFFWSYLAIYILGTDVTSYQAFFAWHCGYFLIH